MIASLNTPARRISFAIALSVLVHAAILWMPYFHLPRAHIELPPLTVTLVPARAPRPDGKHPPANPEPASPLLKPDGGSPARTGNSTLPRMRKSEPHIAAHPFPEHLQLAFIVYQGASGSITGEIHDRLDLHADRYTLTSERQSAGPASLRNSDRLIQTSSGKIVEHGLQPDTFEVQIINRDGAHGFQSTFDRVAQTLRLLDGRVVALPEAAQDQLSFLYQISQLPLNQEFIQIPVSDGAQLQQYQIEIGTQQDLSTPLGKLHTLYLREMHAPGAGYFEIWLGLQYRLLPVKFRLIDSSDRPVEEYVISDIRAGDE